MLFVLLLVCACGIGQEENIESVNETKKEYHGHKLYVELSSPYSKSYFFFLDDGTYRVAKGEGNLDEWIAGDVIEVEAEEIYLNDSLYTKLEEDIDTLGEFASSDFFAYDTWQVSIYLNDTKNNYVYGCSKNPNYDLLIKKLIEISPIDIVDNYGNHALPVN